MHNVLKFGPCFTRYGSYRVCTDPGKSWNFIVQNSRPWKVLEKGIGPGKFWNYKPAVLEFLILV